MLVNLFGQWSFLRLHILAWVALAIAAFCTAGDYAFANCWPLALIYIPPLALAAFAIAAYSAAIILASWRFPQLRDTRHFTVAVHGIVLTAGACGATLLAWGSTGHVSCL